MTPDRNVGSGVLWVPGSGPCGRPAGGGAMQGAPPLRPGSLRSPALRSLAPCMENNTEGENKSNDSLSQTTPLGDGMRETGCPLTAGNWVSLDTNPLASDGLDIRGLRIRRKFRHRFRFHRGIGELAGDLTCPKAGYLVMLHAWTRNCVLAESRTSLDNEVPPVVVGTLERSLKLTKEVQLCQKKQANQ